MGFNPYDFLPPEEVPDTYTWAGITYTYEQMGIFFQVLGWLLSDGKHVSYKVALIDNNSVARYAKPRYIIFFEDEQDLTYLLLKFPSRGAQTLRPNTVKYGDENIQFIRT